MIPRVGAGIVVVSSFSGNPGGGDYTLTFARGSYAYSAASTASEEHGVSQTPGENPEETK